MLSLLGNSTVMIRQRRELVELFGFETRNKYSVEAESGELLGFAAEQQKGLFGFMLRQILGHWRSFEIHIFDPDRKVRCVAKHPFRFYFERLEICSNGGELLGCLERRFEILGKRFDLCDASGNLLMTVRSPLWRIWTFPFKRSGQDVAVVTKRWGGVVKELFTDADTFALQFIDSSLPEVQRMLLVAAAIFIDLRYFERKANAPRIPSAWHQ